jgi:hypothetical protein
MICPPSFSDDEKRHFDASDYIAGRCGDAGGVPLEGESWFFDFARNDKSFLSEGPIVTSSQVLPE